MFTKKRLFLIAIIICFSASFILSAHDLQFDCSSNDLFPEFGDGPRYRVSSLEITYDNPHRDRIKPRDLMQVSVELVKTQKGFIAKKKDLSYETFSLEQLQDMDQPHWFYRSALKAITDAVVNYYNKQGIRGIKVRVPENEIGKDGINKRLSGDTHLTLVITTARIGQLRTLGRRADKQTNTYQENQKRHRYILDGSPLKPGEAYADNDGDLLNNNSLDNYVYFLNRYPHRRLDARVKPLQNDRLAVDFMITESKPWYIWVNAANTGVPQTSDWVESVGLTHTQLFHFDDTLKLHYSTDGLQNVYTAYGSYEFPFFLRKIRLNTNVLYNHFESSELGILGERFVGQQFAVTAGFVTNPFQRQDLFVDFSPSIQYRNVYVHNPALGTTTAQAGSQTFVMPKFELSIEKAKREYHFNLACAFEVNPIWTDSDRKKIDVLGRYATSPQWNIFHWNTLVSFYLESLFLSGHRDVLANELLVKCRGQYAFHYRVIPQMKGVIGGFNTVRGYPEALTSGDSIYLTTVEYLLHIPRLLPSQKKAIPYFFGKSFRIAPQYPGGPIDWDLILRPFIDIGNAVNNDRIAFETDATLIGTGVGLELLFRQHFACRFDWGLAMKGVPILDVKANDSRFNYSITLIY